MADYRVASRYAKSLLDIGVEQQNLDVLMDDINKIKTALTSRDLTLLVKSPIINAGKKVEILKVIFEGKIDKMSMAFLELITKKGREKFLPEMVTSFISQYKKHNKITAVKLTTANALTPEVLTSIKQTV